MPNPKTLVVGKEKKKVFTAVGSWLLSSHKFTTKWVITFDRSVHMNNLHPS